MRASRLISIASASILKNKMRTLLTMLGIIIGVAAVMVMVAVGQGARDQIQQQIDNLGTNLIVITPGAAAGGGVSQGAGTFVRLTIADADALKQQSTLLTGVSPMIVAPVQAVGGVGNWRTMVNGVTTDYAAIRNWSVVSGRLFDETDARSMRKVAVIGQTVARNVFPNQDPVGAQLRLRNVPFEVIGLLAPKGQTASGSDQDDVILVPSTTAQTRLSGRQFIPQILASAASKAEIPAAEQEMRGIMRESHKLADYEPDDFTIRNQNDLADAAQGTTSVMTLLLAAIASISLLVGGIGIMNIMLVSVTERTREIGIRMAIGARRIHIMLQFLVESVLLSIIGGLAGALLGMAVSKLLSIAAQWPTLISPLSVVGGFLFAAAVGVFFGFYPAYKAALLNPIDALRYE